MRYFLAVNSQGFINSWHILAFDGRANRRRYYNNILEYNPGFAPENLMVREVTKGEISRYIEPPKRFHAQCYGLEQDPNFWKIPGYLGDVAIVPSDEADRSETRIYRQ